MKKLLALHMIILFFFIGCKNKRDTNLHKDQKPIFSLEKIVVIDNKESSVTYFKIKVKNDNDRDIVFLDNSLVEYYRKNLKPTRKGFYLKNISNDSLIMLGIDNYYFYEFGAKKSGYIFLGAVNLKESSNENDSIKFKNKLSNYTLEYNGESLNLNGIKKSFYITQNDYANFINKKEKLIPFKDSIVIAIPKKTKIKYINKLPIAKDEWDSL